MLPLITVVLAAIAGIAVIALATLIQGRAAHPQLSEVERADLLRLRHLVDDIKELAWDHREVDPDLSTIVIDTIRGSERGGGSELR